MLTAKDTWSRTWQGALVPSRRDALLLGYLPVMALIAWCTPEAAWMPICTRVAQISGRAGSRRFENTRRIANLLSPDQADDIAAGIGAHHHHARLQLFRCYRSPPWRPSLWRPAITVVGREHLEAALASRAGVVLWVAPFVYSNLITKMALHDAGFAIAHLSGPQHGLSTSLFGQRFLNPIWTNIESRFLAERVVMTTAEASAALRTLMRRVKENRLVSITMGPHGTRCHTLPFLRGRIILANGAPSLARRTGAALLPVFTVQTNERRWVTTIEAPASALAASEDGEREVVEHCARLLESYVRRWPDQFDGWTMTET